MTDFIFGIDCATDPRKRGIAVASYTRKSCNVESAATDLCDDELVELINRHMRTNNRVLLALDAPLGWPSKMCMALTQHQAGRAISTEPNDMFRRTTDHFIKKEYGIQSLDIGADRIARTAHSALQLLERLRQRCHNTIPLTMNQKFTGMAAIEVYPAATLKVCDLPFKQYKKADEIETRQAIIKGLKQKLIISDNIQNALIKSADALDAVICICAGLHFLQGKAKGPVDKVEREAAEKEGWIWVKIR